MPGRVTAAVAVLLGLLSSASSAQEWPTRPVTMVVPFAAGGPVDTLGRILQPRLSEVLGQQVVIENIGGAGGMTGSNRVREAAPDGYTFVLGSVGSHVLNQLLAKRPLYNAATDFTPVILVADAPLILITRKDLPLNTLSEFIAYARQNQGRMQFGSGGTGTSSHIGCVLLHQKIGVDIVHLPYRGGGPALQDLIAGRIDHICNIASTAVPSIEAKSVKAIAMLSRERSPVMPELPTAHEQGLTDFDAYTWNAAFLPKDTPAPIVAKLNAAFAAALDTPSVRERLASIGLFAVEAHRRSPEYLAKLVVSETEKWAGPIKASGAGEP